jgi:hypothetical protein
VARNEAKVVNYFALRVTEQKGAGARRQAGSQLSHSFGCGRRDLRSTAERSLEDEGTSSRWISPSAARCVARLLS